MKPVILVPYRSDGAERERNWNIARPYWERLGWPIVTGDTPDTEFHRARARNEAALLGLDWDVALFADADIVLRDPVRQAEAAIMRAFRTGAYTVAYSDLHYVDEQGVGDMLDEGRGPMLVDCDESVGLTWECCFAVRRDYFDKVGGFDNRFTGYGWQVAAFFYAYATFGGRERIDGDAFHLHHPPVDRSSDPYFDLNKRLAERYKEAVDNVEAMKKILAEPRPS